MSSFIQKPVFRPSPQKQTATEDIVHFNFGYRQCFSRNQLASAEINWRNLENRIPWW